MFEQSLDNEFYANPYFPHHNDARFYDDYQHTTYLKYQQQQQPNVAINALPTPPSTPDKIPMNYGNFTQNGYLPPLQLPHQHHSPQGNPFSPTGDMQVVPDFPCDETDDSSLQREGNNYPPPPALEDGRYNSTYLQLSPPHCLEIPPAEHIGKTTPYPPALMHQDMINFMNYHNTQHPRCNEENYYQQLAIEQIRNQNKLITEPNYENNEPELSRATHNVLERQRRNDLKVRFNVLRDQIPDLAHNDKAPKIQILKKGHEYLKYLKKEEQMLLVDKELEKQKKLILHERLRLLQRSR